MLQNARHNPAILAGADNRGQLWTPSAPANEIAIHNQRNGEAIVPDAENRLLRGLDSTERRLGIPPQPKGESHQLNQAVDDRSGEPAVPFEPTSHYDAPAAHNR